MKIGLPVLENKILSGFTIYGRGGHLGHVTQISRSNFRPHYPGMLHIKFHFDWPGQAVSEKKTFEKCVWMADLSRSREMSLA